MAAGQRGSGAGRAQSKGSRTQREERPRCPAGPLLQARPVRSASPPLPRHDPLGIDAELTRHWLVEFIRDEVQRRRKFDKVVVGLSGGVDSALVAFLAAEALGPANVLGVRMPYRTSSPESLDHAQLVIDQLGIPSTTVDISPAVDALAGTIEGTSSGRAKPMEPARLGNIMARTRMITLFDLSAAHRALPLGTGNKTERLLGYFTWHADDSPPVNPIGDLFKTQVWSLARHVGVPEVIVSKPASADLIKGQTDEGDFGISYPRADAILHWILLGYRGPEIEALGFSTSEIGSGSKAAGLDPLETPASHRGDAEWNGDRRVLSQTSRLLKAVNGELGQLRRAKGDITGSLLTPSFPAYALGYR